MSSQVSSSLVMKYFTQGQSHRYTEATVNVAQEDRQCLKLLALHRDTHMTFILKI